MAIPHNTSDTSRIRVTLLIWNALGELDDTATVDDPSDLQVSYNGAAWTNAPGTLVNTGGGAYYYQGVLADAQTAGKLKVKFEKGGFLTSIAEEDVEATVDADHAIEGAYTRDDLIRLIARTLVGPMEKVGTNYVYKDLNNTKASHTGTVTASGRVAFSIVDPT